MSNDQRDERPIYVDRSWPPMRIWGYVVLPAVLLAIPTVFVGGDFRVLAWVAIGLWVGIMGLTLVLGAQRNWWITSAELRINRLPLLARAFYGFSGREHVSLANVEAVEAMEGSGRAIRERAYGTAKPHVRQGFGGSCDQFWCKGAVIVQLLTPDDYGEAAVLSTLRPEEAAAALTRAVDEARQRGGMAT